MHRRQYLSALALGGASGLAGCTGADRVAPLGDRSTTTPAPTGGRDVDLPVPTSQLRRGAPRDFIPAITDPAFADDWAAVEQDLLDEDRVIGVDRGGEARAYPLRVMLQHEVVNDVLAGPILVTYCPLCRSGITAERTVRGETTTFGVSGLLWLENLVMYDRLTGSLWGQFDALAIRGPATGARLSLLPTTFTTWGQWRETFPDASVLVPPPVSGSVDGHEPFGNYPPYTLSEYKSGSRFGVDGDYEGLHPKELVVGIAHGGTARAYPFGTVADRGVVNDTVGGLPVVVAAAPDDVMTAFVRRVGGEVLTFEPADTGRMWAGESAWETLTGRALDGPYVGASLERATDIGPMFWSNWQLFHPDTTVYEGVPAA